MAERKAAAKQARNPAQDRTDKAAKGFTDDEKAAMRAHAKELRAAALEADGEKQVLEAIAALGEPDRALAQRFHALVKASAPVLAARTWYGMPAYAKDGKIVCHFQPAEKFKTRYATFGFQDSANLDEGALWPVGFALTKLTAAEGAKLAALVKKAVG
jgi:uncharacterized protein YdhG (YjbR/CyaY superfamily)